MLDPLRRCRLSVILIMLLVMAQVAAAQETIGSPVTVDDWSHRSSGLLIGIIFVAVITIVFGAVAVRRARRTT